MKTAALLFALIWVQPDGEYIILNPGIDWNMCKQQALSLQEQPDLPEGQDFKCQVAQLEVSQ